MATKINAPAHNTIKSNNEGVFYDLLRAETENDVSKIMDDRGMMQNESDWKPLGEMENNWSAAGNQQSAPAAALVEKIVNGIDAVLVYECLKKGV